MFRTDPLKIFFDGGCRPNPGRIEVAVVARGKVLFFDDLGDGSSSDAEWLALCRAVEVARSLGEPVFDLLGDNRSVIDQAGGAAPARSPLFRDHLLRYRTLAAEWPPRRVRWVPRQQNLAGIALSSRHSSTRAPTGGEA